MCASHTRMCNCARLRAAHPYERPEHRPAQKTLRALHAPLTERSMPMIDIESLTTSTGLMTMSGGTWQRIIGEDPQLFQQMRDRYGVDLTSAAPATYYSQNEFACLPLTFLERSGSSFEETRALIAVGKEVIITVEPGHPRSPIARAVTRMKRDEIENESSTEIAAAILQAISDSTDALVSELNESTEHMMVQTNSILRSLETRRARDFGVSDVTSTQQELADMEELLSRCMESQLSLAEAARHLRVSAMTGVPTTPADLTRLIEDVEAVEQHIDFVHDRVRLLQQTNNLALNVKQNQIIKVFSVVTAVFLPVMLLSTYYSMNFEFMPILAWKYAEPMIIVLSFVFAMLPLIYVRRRGWLR